MTIMDDEKMRTLWCGNLSSRITDEILYELFLQVRYKTCDNLPFYPENWLLILFTTFQF